MLYDLVTYDKPGFCLMSCIVIIIIIITVYNNTCISGVISRGVTFNNHNAYCGTGARKSRHLRPGQSKMCGHATSN